MRGAIPPFPQYVFMAWCLLKHRDNFIFYSLLQGSKFRQNAGRYAVYLLAWMRNVRLSLFSIRGLFEKFVDWRQCAAVMQRQAVHELFK
jgi:hypothetical protein